MTQKAVFIGLDGVAIEKVLLLGLSKQVDLSKLSVVEGYTGGVLGTASQQPTVSGPGWSTNLTGVWTDQHGITSNNDRPINPAVSSIFERIDAAIPNATIASIVNWSPINTGHFALEAGYLGEPAIIDYERHGLSDAAVTDETINLINTVAPDFTFLHIDGPDGAGHDAGYGAVYNQALITAFNYVNEIIDAVAAREAANPDEDWIVVVSTDHGRDPLRGSDHGGQTDEERRTFIAATEALGTFTTPVPNTSIVATILDFMGIRFDLSELESGSLLEGAPDPLPPTLAELVTPKDGATVVSVSTDLVMRFSENVEAGSGFISVWNYATDTLVQRVSVTSGAVVFAGDTVTVDLPDDLGAGTRYYVTIDRGAITDRPSIGSSDVLFFEDFERLAGDLGPFVSPTETGGDGTDWTATLPAGWSRDNGSTPTGGPAEFFGWTFFDKSAWVATAGDQGRSGFLGGKGIVAVADGDEYDDGDVGIDPDAFQSILTTPSIDISGREAGSLVLSFNSSWRPEDLQEARITVSFDGGAPVEILRWTSDPSDPTFKPDAVDELVRLAIPNPAGATSMVVSFDMPAAGNDWWWAIDNVAVAAEGALSTNDFRGISDKNTWDFTTDVAASLRNIWTEDWESLAGDLGPFVSDTESGGDGTDWTPTPPAGWTLSTGTTPASGPAEFFGWTFIDVDAWATTAGDQRRTEFGNASGVIAVADPDEYDDGATDIDPDLFDATMVSPEIDISGVAADRLRFSFDSSWRPEDTQEVRLLVSFDGGAPTELLHWTSNPLDATYHPDATNERLVFDLANPAGAKTVQFTFEMPAAGNDWWWAVDNLSLDEIVPVTNRVTVFFEDFESLAADLGPLVSPSEAGGDGTDWTANPPAGWAQTVGTPEGGPVEFYGWTFFDKTAWIATAGDQGRSEFTRGSGIVAVADPDEYDDLGDIDPNQFNAFLETPEIDLSRYDGDTLRLEFDSSFRPSGSQTGRVEVSYDGGATWTTVLTLDSAALPDLANIDERIVIDLPAGDAASVIARFGLTEAGNDWWWAVDNVGFTAVADETENEAPTIGVTSFVLDENTRAIGNILAADREGPIAGYAIAGGPDGQLVRIDDAGNLVLKFGPDFETPTDADRDGVYSFDVTVTDVDGAATTATVAVTVADVAETETVSRSGLRTDAFDPATGDLVSTTYENGGRVKVTLFGPDGGPEASITRDYDGVSNFDTVVRAYDEAGELARKERLFDGGANAGNFIVEDFAAGELVARARYDADGNQRFDVITTLFGSEGALTRTKVLDDGTLKIRGLGLDVVLTGGAGDDRFIAGAGAETIRLAPVSGADRVVGFDVAVDRLDVSAYGIGAVADLAGVEERKAGVFLDLDGENSIFLHRLTAADVTDAIFA
jgi:hypothetical protein